MEVWSQLATRVVCCASFDISWDRDHLAAALLWRPSDTTDVDLKQLAHRYYVGRLVMVEEVPTLQRNPLGEVAEELVDAVAALPESSDAAVWASSRLGYRVYP